MREPAFWWRPTGLASSLLAPIGAAYGAIVARRMARANARVGVPVLCVGNFTLGGAGKTPTVMMLARLLQDEGARPYCLSRGYGGSLAGPKTVDVHRDSAAQVGDEALLLAQVAPTIIARDRLTGAKAAQAAGASVVIMDDGLQNPSLAKDFTIAVVDGRRGVGNGKLFPAGPLRAPLAAQLARTHALLIVGEDGGARDVVAAAGMRGLPVWHCRLVPHTQAIADLKARKILAFAGIGDPEKFFAITAAAGLSVVQRRPFADHHRYTAEEAGELIMQAEHDGLALLTTEKDRARMAGERLLGALAMRAHTLPVTMVVEEPDDLRQLVMSRLKR